MGKLSMVAKSTASWGTLPLVVAVLAGTGCGSDGSPSGSAPDASVDSSAGGASGSGGNAGAAGAVVGTGGAAGAGGNAGSAGGPGTGGSAGSAGAGGAAGASGSAGAGGSTPTCGNGQVDAQETCDTAIPGNDPGACETSCDDQVACTTDQLKDGGTCQAVCAHTLIAACVAGDGCCPAACNSATDSDCSPTCGNGIVEANELCDKAIAAGNQGSCPTTCSDGIPCTSDTLINAGTCTAQCASASITTCANQDGCCALGCVADEDCAQVSRFKQSVVTESGGLSWSRNGYWNGSAYGSWSPWNGVDLSQLVTGYGNGQTYRCLDESLLSDGRLKQTALALDGVMSFARYGTWNGNGYASWTAWTGQYGSLGAIVPGQGTNQAYRSYDHVMLPDGRLQQTLLTFDGRKLWQRVGTWDGAAYTWTAWSDAGGDLTKLLPGKGDSQSFRSFDNVLMADTRQKQTVLTEDGKTIWSRYGTWDGKAYSTYSDWSDKWGDLRQLLPGQGADQSYLCFHQSTLGGAGYSGGCQNGCDDGDPCTVDACVSNACQHEPKGCDDGNACTQDSCVSGICQHAGMDCDDGNACTDDSCSNGCQHSNNSASCYGGQCQNGTCQASCQCDLGCKDSCGQACNEGVKCATNAVCKGGTCACSNVLCGGVCCGAGETCSNGICCGSQADRCTNRCGSITDKCGVVSCPSTCDAGFKCCAGGYCDEICQ